MKLKVKRVEGEMRGILPTRGSAKAAGLDLYTYEERTLRPGQTHLFPTGIIVEIPDGYEGQVRPRSGLAAKHSITVLNAPGTIDSDYRGEVKVILHNAGSQPFKIDANTRIAQLVVKKVEEFEPEWSNEVTETERGSGGFGSTGLK